MADRSTAAPPQAATESTPACTDTPEGTAALLTPPSDECPVIPETEIRNAVPFQPSLEPSTPTPPVPLSLLDRVSSGSSGGSYARTVPGGVRSRSSSFGGRRRSSNEASGAGSSRDSSSTTPNPGHSTGLFGRLRSLSSSSMGDRPPTGAAVMVEHGNDVESDVHGYTPTLTATTGTTSSTVSPSPASMYSTHTLDTGLNGKGQRRQSFAEATVDSTGANSVPYGRTTPSAFSMDVRRGFWGRLSQSAAGTIPWSQRPELASEVAGDSAGGSAIGPDKADVDLAFWAEVVHGGAAMVKRRYKQVGERVRNGIPPGIRGIVWQTICNAKDRELEERYRSLIPTSSQWDREIARDIDRTFPNHESFAREERKQSLFKVLKAYALYDPEVGYCQGQAFVVGLLLMHMPEEETFSMLVHWMKEFRLRMLYREGMEGLHIRAYQLKVMMQEQLPALYRHMEECGVQILMFASQWFMALFATDFQLDVVLRIIDVMVVEGEDVLLRFALALLRANQEILLTLKFEQMLDHLRHHLYTTNLFKDPSDLVAEAFRIKLSERRLAKLEVEGRALLEEQNREKSEVVQLRTDRRELDARIKVTDAKLQQALEEQQRLATELALTKCELASARERNDELEMAIRQYQKMMLCDGDERLSEIARLSKDLRTAEHMNHELARDLVDVKMRYATCQSEKEQAEHELEVERRRRSATPRVSGTSISVQPTMPRTTTSVLNFEQSATQGASS